MFCAINVVNIFFDELVALLYPSDLTVQDSASREGVSTQALIEGSGCSIVEIHNAGGDPFRLTRRELSRYTVLCTSSQGVVVLGLLYCGCLGGDMNSFAFPLYSPSTAFVRHLQGSLNL